MSRIIGRVAMLALGALLAFGLLAGAESVLWLLDLGGGRHQDPFTGFSNIVPMFEPTQDESGTPVFRTAKAREAPVPAEFTANKPEAGFRVFVVGGSSTAGTPYDYRNAFGAWLARRLTKMLPDVPTEVVNAGIDAYGSRRILSVVREVAQYEPDLLIIYMGHNEIAESRYYAHLIDLHPALFRLWTWIANTRLYVVLSESGPLATITQRLRAEPVGFGDKENVLEYFAAADERLDGAVPSARDLEYRELHYRNNLEAMIDSMRVVGAQVMLVTQSQNFADWPPGASSHAPELSDEARREWERLVRQGDRLRAASGCEGALPFYLRALDVDDQFAALHFRIANCERSIGRDQDSSRHYRLASDLDRVPNGAPTRYNEIVREIALANGEDVLLVDVEQILANESPGGIVGNNWFCDLVHPNLRAHQRIAAALADALREAGVPASRDRWRVDAYRDPDVETLYRKDPQLRQRERTILAVACMLSRLRSCALENAEAVLAIEPHNEVALGVLKVATELPQSGDSL